MIIFVAKYLIILPVLAALYIAWKLPREKRLDYVVRIVATGALAYAAAKTLSLFFYNARPFVSENIVPLISHAADNGFPSDHTLLAAVLAAVATYFNRNIGIALWISVLLIGSARVAAGVHHPIDIIGSIIIAIAAATIIAFAFKKKSAL